MQKNIGMHPSEHRIEIPITVFQTMTVHIVLKYIFLIQNMILVSKFFLFINMLNQNFTLKKTFTPPGGVKVSQIIHIWKQHTGEYYTGQEASLVNHSNTCFLFRATQFMLALVLSSACSRAEVPEPSCSALSSLNCSNWRRTGGEGFTQFCMLCTTLKVCLH